jgi:hypothetical protein
VLLVGAGTGSDTGRFQRVVLPGLPEFNAADPAWVVTRFEGWYSTVVAAPHLVPNGGGPGAVAIRQEPGEAYYTLSGSIDCGSWESLEAIRTLLMQALVGGETAVTMLDDRAGGHHRQVFVHAYDRPEIEAHNAVLNFTFPLVAPDPYKYGLVPLAASAGAFEATDWYRTYVEAGGDWYRTYTPDGSVQYRTYEEDADLGSSLPPSAVLTSSGDATSRRMTITVTGPLTAGEWWLEDSVGTRLWAEVSLAEGQSIVFDCLDRSASLAGADIGHLVQGDYLALRPGINTYRLQVGTTTEGYANFEALEAYL